VETFHPNRKHRYASQVWRPHQKPSGLRKKQWGKKPMSEFSLPSRKEHPLRKPIYEAKFGEALEECRKLETNSIDLVLTDPPFNHETEHYVTRQEKFLKASKSFADFAIMRQFFREIAKEFQRVLKPKARVLLFCDCYSYPIFWSSFYDLFDHVRALVWYKGKGYYGLGCNQAFRYSYEMILHAFNTDSWFDMAQRQDVLTCHNVPSNKREHPAQKPIELLMKLIIATCPKNGLVLDPFMGSGSTLLAAKYCERSALGFDANESFVEIANKNLGQPQLQVSQKQLLEEVSG